MKEYTIRLYHYTKAENLDKILSSGLIRLTSATKTNDPFEGAICHPRTDEEINENLKTVCEKKWESDLRDEPDLIVSLSGLMSSPSMWGHYADSHKGVCLVFDIPVLLIESTIENECYNELVDRSIAPVEYEDEKPIPMNIYNVDKENYQRILRDAILRKGKEWEFEHEVRIIVASGLATPSKHTDIVWVDEWPYYNGLMGYLRGVILGLRCDKVVSWVEMRLHELNYDGIIVARASASPTDYKVEVKGDDGNVVFVDSNVDAIKREFKDPKNRQTPDRIWFMHPRIAKVREK